MPSVSSKLLPNCRAECIHSVGVFVSGSSYPAVYTPGVSFIVVERPDNKKGESVSSMHFAIHTEQPTSVRASPCAVDDRDAPSNPLFEDQYHEQPVEESTFVHKSATRKTQEVHEENEGTANLRKYRFKPDTF